MVDALTRATGRRKEAVCGARLTPGPFPVGRYARDLQQFLRGRAKVLVMGEVTGFRRAR